MAKPNKQDYKNITFDQSRHLIVSMHDCSTMRNYESSPLRYAINYTPPHTEPQTKQYPSATLIVNGTPQNFYKLLTTGFVINPKSINIERANSFDFASFGGSGVLIKKTDVKPNTNHPNKYVTTFVHGSDKRSTAYDVYDISSDTSNLNRTNEEALNYYTKAIEYKNANEKVKANNPKWKAKTRELMYSQLENAEKGNSLGLFVDISQSSRYFFNFQFDSKVYQKLCEENPHFKVYIFNEGEIRVVEKNISQFLEGLSRYQSIHLSSMGQDLGQSIEDFAKERSVLLSEMVESSKINISNVTCVDAPNSFFSCFPSFSCPSFLSNLFSNKNKCTPATDNLQNNGNTIGKVK